MAGYILRWCSGPQNGHEFILTGINNPFDLRPKPALQHADNKASPLQLYNSNSIHLENSIVNGAARYTVQQTFPDMNWSVLLLQMFCHSVPIFSVSRYFCHHMVECHCPSSFSCYLSFHFSSNYFCYVLYILQLIIISVKFKL